MIHNFSSTHEQPPVSTLLDFRSDVEQSNPLFQAHDVDSADISIVRQITREMIQVNGANVKIHARTDNADHDKVFDEDADPTYWPPISDIKGFFVPQPLEYELTLWGVDTNNKTEIVFSLEEIASKLPNRLLRPGDLIEVPYNSQSQQKPRYYAVNNAQEFGNFRYTWLYMKCQATLLVGEINLRPAQDAVASVDEYTDEVDG